MEQHQSGFRIQTLGFFALSERANTPAVSRQIFASASAILNLFESLASPMLLVLKCLLYRSPQDAALHAGPWLL